MAYGTEAGFTAYHTARGNDISGMDSAAIAVALVVGSDYVDGRGGRCFVGRRTAGYDQEGEWPRTGAVTTTGYPIPSDTVPTPVVNAAYEAGFFNFGTPGGLTPAIAPDARRVLTQVDVLRWSVVGGSDPDALRTVLTRVDDLLAPFIDCTVADGNAPFFGVIG